jgi:Fur family transcriptional regulator, ferric uptake regulator
MAGEEYFLCGHDLVSCFPFFSFTPAAKGRLKVLRLELLSAKRIDNTDPCVNISNRYYSQEEKKVGDKVARMTKQRRIILDSLGKVTSHPTADEVYQMVRAELPRVSLGTVYRNLEILSAEGRLQKLDQSPGQRRFDGDITPHFHARCLKCGRIFDLPGATPVEVDQSVGSRDGFHITGYRLEFVGTCSDCGKD